MAQHTTQDSARSIAQGGEESGVAPFGRDAEGWALPNPRHKPPNQQPSDERENQARLIDVLQRCGWTINEHVFCYTRDGEARIPDLVVEHPAIEGLTGAVEVKADVCDDKEATKALKQAIDYTDCKEFLPDYTNCKVLATGRRIRWAAVYPFRPDIRETSGPLMWGALKLAGTQFKTAAFVEDRHFKAFKQMCGFRAAPPQIRRLLLLYTHCDVLWSSDHGWNANAANMLGGKRQVGGQRK